MKPTREHATNLGQTYMVTSATWDRQGHFRKRWARLLTDTLYHYRGSAYLLHEFVIMPDHLHALITPLTNLEKAVQFIKGGFSFRLKSKPGVWERGYNETQVQSTAQFEAFRHYIEHNPVQKRMVAAAQEYPWSSAAHREQIDPPPQWFQ